VEFRAPRARDRDGDDVIDHSPASTLRVRRGTAADAAVLARHRADMFRDIGRLDAATYAPLLLASTEYFARAIPTGEYVAWIATTGDATETPVAGAGVQVRTLLPRPNETGTAVLPGPEGIVLNVYTDPTWRRLGVAELLMGHVLEWSRARGLGRLVLHASHDGRPLYEKLGFVATNEMRYTGIL
jgi:ribosomal protein S18 acetylase RimI-like enzyme